MGGHIGDGNFHSMMVYRSEEEHAKVDEACRRLVQRAIELDGTCMYPIRLIQGLYTHNHILYQVLVNMVLAKANANTWSGSSVKELLTSSRLSSKLWIRSTFSTLARCAQYRDLR